MHGESGTPSSFALGLQPGAEQIGPLSHPQQPKVTAGCKFRGASGDAKASAVICRFQFDPFVKDNQHGPMAGFRVMHDIVQSFLRNAIQSQLPLARQPPFLAGLAKVHDQMVGLAAFTRQHFERRDQPQVFKVDWAQRPRQPAQVFDRLLGEGFKLLERVVPAPRLDRLLRELHALFERDHGLDRIIVNFTR